jgi:hypothetical protein
MSRYQSLRPLGTGLDGTVEEVRPDRLGGEPLARRRVPVPAGPRRLRLRDTAETLARLGHPGIATVVDVVEVDESCVDVVRMLGTDGTLDDRGPLTVDAVRGLLGEVAAALAAAHGAGVAHGHVSPANVLLRDGRPVLADFGLREARTGLPVADPFRADVRDLATMGNELIDPAGPSPVAEPLRALLRWVADDPDASLGDLRRGLASTEGPAPPPPPPPPLHVVPTSDAAGGRRRVPAALVGVAALVLGLVAGAAVVVAPGIARSRPAPEPACAAVEAPLRADVDGDGCDDPVEWRADDAEVAYPGPDGTLVRFRVGRPGDDLVLGDWDCDGTATAAVVRPDTGQTFVFDAWAADGETLAAEPGPSLPDGATATVVDEGGCDRIRPARA